MATIKKKSKLKNTQSQKPKSKSLASLKSGRTKKASAPVSKAKTKKSPAAKKAKPPKAVTKKAGAVKAVSKKASGPKARAQSTRIKNSKIKTTSRNSSETKNLKTTKGLTKTTSTLKTTQANTNKKGAGALKNPTKGAVASLKKPSHAGKTIKSKTTKAQRVHAASAPRRWADFLTPLDNRILVRFTAVSDRTPGGLYIPATANTERPQQGEVVATGPGHRDKKGRLRPLDLKVGDEVLFARYAGDQLEVLGETILILREEDVLGVIN